MIADVYLFISIYMVIIMTLIYLPLYSFLVFLLFLSSPFVLYFYYVSGTDKLGGMVDSIAYVFF